MRWKSIVHVILPFLCWSDYPFPIARVICSLVATFFVLFHSISIVVVWLCWSSRTQTVPTPSPICHAWGLPYFWFRSWHWQLQPGANNGLVLALFYAQKMRYLVLVKTTYPTMSILRFSRLTKLDRQAMNGRLGNQGSQMHCAISSCVLLN